MSDTQREFLFRTFYSEHAESILGYALRRVPAAEAGDVVAETFLLLWRRIDDAPPGDELLPWLYGVARKVIQNTQRSSTRRNRLGAKLQSRLVESSAEFEKRTTDGIMVHDALLRLDPDDRELLYLTAFEGCSTKEISLAMGVPWSTVRTRLRRARQRFADQISNNPKINESDYPGPDIYPIDADI